MQHAKMLTFVVATVQLMAALSLDNSSTEALTNASLNGESSGNVNSSGNQVFLRGNPGQSKPELKLSTILASQALWCSGHSCDCFTMTGDKCMQNFGYWTCKFKLGSHWGHCSDHGYKVCVVKQYRKLHECTKLHSGPPPCVCGMDSKCCDPRYKWNGREYVLKNPPTNPPTNGNCEDSNSQCGAWANAGECRKNPGYMHDNCKKSCGTCAPNSGSVTLPVSCKDGLPHKCPIFARANLCWKQPRLTKTCDKSCGRCSR